MIKLICFDVDGTINDGWKILPDLFIKMERIQKLGVKMAVLTGRDNFTALYFIHNAGFPFDYCAGRGDAGVITNPLNPHIRQMFDARVIQRIQCGPHIHKEESLLELQKICGTTNEETLYCEDNQNQSANIQKVKEMIHCVLATPATGNEEWKTLVRDRGGFLSDKICGWGTLEILNHYFPNG